MLSSMRVMWLDFLLPIGDMCFVVMTLSMMEASSGMRKDQSPTQVCLMWTCGSVHLACLSYKANEWQCRSQ